MPGVVALALRVSQHPERHAKGTVPPRVGWPVDAHHWLAQCAGQVQRSRVPGDDQADPAGQGDQSFQCKLGRLGNTSAGAHDLGSDPLLLRTRVNQHHAALGVQGRRYRTVALGRPTLRSPARTWAQQDHWPVCPTQYFIRPLFRLAVAWQGGKNGRKRLPSRRCANFHGLLDYVHPLGCNPLTEKPACGPLARLVFSDHPRGAGQPAGERRTHCALQIDAQIVVLRPQCMPQGSDLSQRLSPQRSTSPFFGFYQVGAIHQRHLAAISTEKRAPARFDRPTQIPLWMGPAQSSNRRQGMQNIAHRAQPHNQDAG